MKKQLIAAVLTLPLLVATPVYATTDHQSEPPHKMTVCHSPSETGDHCDRYVINSNKPNEHFHPNGSPKKGHEQDRLLEGEVDCHSQQESEEAKANHEKEHAKPAPVVVAPEVKPESKPEEKPVVQPVVTPEAVTSEAQQEQVEQLDQEFYGKSGW